MSQHADQPTQRYYLEEVWEDRIHGDLIRPILSSVNLQSEVFITMNIGSSNSEVRFVFRRVAQTTPAQATDTRGAQFTLAWHDSHVTSMSLSTTSCPFFQISAFGIWGEAYRTKLYVGTEAITSCELHRIEIFA
jgi:hypothetical protein